MAPRADVGWVLARTIGIGLRLAPRIWPLAALLCLPSFVLERSVDAGTLSEAMLWMNLAQATARVLALEVLAAAMMPSLIRSFARPAEATRLRARELKGRVLPLLATTVVVLVILQVFQYVVAPVLLPTTWSDFYWSVFRYLSTAALFVLVKLLLDLATPVAVIERCRPIRALRRSLALSRSGAALLELFVSNVVIVAVIAAPQGAAWLVSRLVDAPLSMDQAGLLVGPAGFALALPFAIAREALLYHRYRLRVDGVDSARIAQDATPVRNGPPAGDRPPRGRHE